VRRALCQRVMSLERRVSGAPALEPPPEPWRPDDAYSLAVLRILQDLGGVPLLRAVCCPQDCEG
jgi:hypothetical protein